jgi:hypothetical protein
LVFLLSDKEFLEKRALESLGPQPYLQRYHFTVLLSVISISDIELSFNPAKPNSPKLLESTLNIPSHSSSLTVF